MNEECEEFRQGTRKWNICNGLTELPEDKVNTYRRSWGLPPLDSFPENVERISTVVHSGRDSVKLSRTSAPAVRNPKKCKSCRTKIKRPVEASGPGTELIAIYKKAGVPPCQACKQTAKKMDEWGAAKCLENIGELVEEILPRATRWIKENKPWVARLLPNVIEDAAVRIKIKSDLLSAIDTAEKKRKTCSKGKNCKQRKQSKRPVEPTAAQRKVRLRPSSPTRPRSPEVSRIVLPETVRKNLIYHVYPMKHNRWLWKWNLDQLVKRIDLFNGRRLIAIVYDEKSDPPEMVQEYLQGHDIEFIVKENGKKFYGKSLGENVTAVELMDSVHSFEHEVTFRAHAKGVSKTFGLDPDYLPTPSGQFSENGESVRDWSEIMYATCLDDWQTVKAQLEEYAMTGPYKRYTRLGRADWFYSGSFYWYEHTRFYARDWKTLEKRRYGVESLPGMMFHPGETGCLHGDRCASLYHHHYMQNKAWPDYLAWQRDTVPNRVVRPGKLTHPKWFESQEGSADELSKIAESSPSDINEHIHSLKSLAERCEHVTEFGVRNGVSTVALLASRTPTLISYDINEPPNIDVLRNAVPHGVDWTFNLGSTLDVEIEPTEMLFIDTLHKYRQLRGELELHGSKASKYLVFHDTVSFGTSGEFGGEGINKAIEEFQTANPHWKTMADFRNCNGLRVLRREN